ncbi:hypothetical protein [Paenibacillus lutimineralis]|uniref:Uncharacterized protein n=1 Tax=Paenibacillus lutimineralis TaxID=2707005 RepID=A0A3Q9I6R8_9BACL|nr:hypothetical protein [Paenibacillus lutimineralis]AZS13767.1 hypothetical protein EI981_04275 [Paenibacillus lutimineralis]
MSKEKKDMLPVSREQVEVEGVYTDELGREEYLHKGEQFPADLVHGTVEWKLTELAQIKHAEGRTDPESDTEED